MNNNLLPFYVGQKVVYITGKNAPKDSVHTVLDIWKQPCGCIVIEIEANTGDPILLGNRRYECRLCKGIYIANQQKRGWAATSFRPLQQLKFPLMTYSKVIEEQLVSAN